MPLTAPVTGGATSGVLRPWKLFLNPSALSFPLSISECSFRLTQNVRFFFTNYVALIFVIFAFTLLTRPLSLILFLCLFAAWIYLISLRDEPFSVLDYDIDRKIVIGFLTVMTSVAIFWANVWSNLFIALIIGAVIVIIHGVLRAPEDSFEDSPYGSLLNAGDNPMGDYSSV